MSVEDQLRNELRDVRHDRDHVTAERDKALERIAELERLERSATQHAFGAEAERDRARASLANAKAEIARLRERGSIYRVDVYGWYLKECDRREELEERLRKVREIRDEIDCSNCEDPAKLHGPDGRCTKLTRFVNGDVQCGCTWGGGDIVAQLDAVLNGEGMKADG